RTRDEIPGTKRLVSKDSSRLKVLALGPVNRPLAFFRSRCVATFERSFRRLNLSDRHNRLQNEALDENSAFGIYDERTEGFAEFLFESIANGFYVVGPMESQARR